MNCYIVNEVTECPHCKHKNKTIFYAFPVGLESSDGTIFANAVVTCDKDEAGCDKDYVAKLKLNTITQKIQEK